MQRFIDSLYKHRNDIFFSLILLVMIALLLILLPKDETKNVIKSLEEKTFDIRQKIISKQKQASSDIVIISVDDPSYEYLIEMYGDWPIPRHVYADIVEYVQSQNPKYVAFDMIFIKSLNRVQGSDEKLASVFNKYRNTYGALNFDDYHKEVRKPPVLHEKFNTKFVNNSSSVKPLKFSNSRIIMDGLLAATDKLGHINMTKSDDGVTRSIPLIVNYPRYNPDNFKEIQDEYYLYMTAKLALDYISKYENIQNPNVEITSDGKLILGNRKISLTKDAEAILNWYGASGLEDNTAFKYVTFWEVLQSIQAKKDGLTPSLSDDTFKDKIVYIGTNVVSLSDIRTVPTSKHFPGVEIHATLLNNILDNSLIHKAPLPYNIFICILLSSMAAYTVFKIRSVMISLTMFSALVGFYCYFTVFTMEKYNVWIWVVIPIAVVLFVFITSYIIKYLIKSRDFEHTYKLATTDGLTELYNHRFFQEQIRKLIKYSKKYNSHFSLIIIDIDFFKKFNDKYGHQAGDAVLKQVAATLKKSVRAGDVVCRYGGEEMTILLNHTSVPDAIRTAKKICQTVAEKKYRLSQDLEVNVTISLGVATFPENGQEPAELIEYADKCLYNAKENGRNQVGKYN